MDNTKHKVSYRQLMLIFIIGFLAAALGAIPYEAREAGQASWLAPAVSFVIMLIPLLLMNNISSHFKGRGLANIIREVFGRYIGVIILVAFTLWFIAVASLYLRGYAEKVVGTVLPGVSVHTLIIPMAVLCAAILSRGLVRFARLNELFFWFIIAAFFLMTVFAIISGAKLTNLLPVGTADALPVLRSSVTVTGIGGFIILIYFLIDKVKPEEHTRGKLLGSYGAAMGAAVLIAAVTVGTLGRFSAGRLTYPYFTVLKSVAFLKPFDSFEALLLSLWIIADFVAVTVFAYMAMGVLGQITNHKSQITNTDTNKKYVLPIILVAVIYAASILLWRSKTSLDTFFRIAVTVNFIIAIAVPVVIFAVGKLRRLL